MDVNKERRLKDLIDEYHKEKLYYDNLVSKSAHVLKNMKDILDQMKEFEDDEIR